jgi:hypothetical protein
VQVFIRGKEGIRKFRGMLAEPPLPEDSREILDILGHYTALNQKLEELEARKPILPGLGHPDPDAEIEIRLVQREIAKLRSLMEMHLRQSKGDE